MKIIINNYKYYPRVNKTSMRPIGWDDYLNKRSFRLSIYKDKCVKGYDKYTTNLYKKLYDEYLKEMSIETMHWDEKLPIICKYFNTDIEDVVTFISPISNIFKLDIEELKLKLNLLLNWIKDISTLKVIIANSENTSIYLGNESGVWNFNKNINLNNQTTLMLEILKIDYEELMELLKNDGVYFYFLLNDSDEMEKELDKLSFALRFTNNQFLDKLYEYPFLLNVTPQLINTNLTKVSNRIGCSKNDLISIMQEYPGFIFWGPNWVEKVHKRMLGYKINFGVDSIISLRQAVKEYYKNF